MAKKIGSAKQLPSGSWRVRYTHKGKSYSKTFPRKSQAEAWREAEERLFLFDEWTPPQQRERVKKLAKMTVTEFYKTLPEKRRWERSTQLTYGSMFKNDIKPVLGDKSLQSVTRDQVRDWYFSMLKTHKGRDKRNRDVYALMATIFNQAVRDELIEVSPVNIEGASRRPPAKREQEIPTPAEFAKFIAKVPARYKAPVLIFAGCSFRVGEWCELRRKDVFHDGNVWKIHVQRQYREDTDEVVHYLKSKRSRWVTIPNGCVPALRQHMETFSQPGREGLLFPNKAGGRVDRRRFNTMLKRVCEETLGHTNTHSHILRHYGGTEFARAGGSLVEIMARLGHSTVNAALQYQHSSQARDIEVANRIVMPLVKLDDEAA